MTSTRIPEGLCDSDFDVQMVSIPNPQRGCLSTLWHLMIGMSNHNHKIVLPCRKKVEPFWKVYVCCWEVQLNIVTLASKSAARKSTGLLPRGTHTGAYSNCSYRCCSVLDKLTNKSKGLPAHKVTIFTWEHLAFIEIFLKCQILSIMINHRTLYHPSLLPSSFPIFEPDLAFSKTYHW